MAEEKKKGYWFTTETGKHVYVEEGQTPKEATEKALANAKSAGESKKAKELGIHKDKMKKVSESEISDEEYEKGMKKEGSKLTLHLHPNAKPITQESLDNEVREMFGDRQEALEFINDSFEKDSADYKNALARVDRVYPEVHRSNHENEISEALSDFSWQITEEDTASSYAESVANKLGYSKEEVFAVMRKENPEIKGTSKMVDILDAEPNEDKKKFIEHVDNLDWGDIVYGNDKDGKLININKYDPKTDTFNAYDDDMKTYQLKYEDVPDSIKEKVLDRKFVKKNNENEEKENDEYDRLQKILKSGKWNQHNAQTLKDTNYAGYGSLEALEQATFSDNKEGLPDDATRVKNMEALANAKKQKEEKIKMSNQSTRNKLTGGYTRLGNIQNKFDMNSTVESAKDTYKKMGELKNEFESMEIPNSQDFDIEDKEKLIKQIDDSMKRLSRDWPEVLEKEEK